MERTPTGRKKKRVRATCAFLLESLLVQNSAHMAWTLHKEDEVRETRAKRMRHSDETCVPVLDVAEQISADDAMSMIQQNHMERGFQLEQLALEARREFEAVLSSRGGQ